MQNPTQNLLLGALAVVMEYQQTGCKKAAQKVLITLRALINSGQISDELISQAENLVEEIEKRSDKQEAQAGSIFSTLSLKSRPMYADLSLE
jgi:hypothetical protein